LAAAFCLAVMILPSLMCLLSCHDHYRQYFSRPPEENSLSTGRHGIFSVLWTWLFRLGSFGPGFLSSRAFRPGHYELGCHRPAPAHRRRRMSGSPAAARRRPRRQPVSMRISVAVRMCGAAGAGRCSQICRMTSAARSRPGSPCPGSSGVSSRCTANWSLSHSAGPPASGHLARAGHRVHRSTQPGRVGMRIDLRGGNAHMPEQILQLIQGAHGIQLVEASAYRI